MEYISKTNGVIVIIRNPKKELDINKNKKQSSEPILKEYGIGAQILLDIGIKKICLLSNTKKNIVGIEGFGLKIHDIKPIIKSSNEKKILIINADYYPEISENLLNSSSRVLKESNVEFEVINVPGALEIPVILEKYKNNFSGFIIFWVCNTWRNKSLRFSCKCNFKFCI